MDECIKYGRASILELIQALFLNCIELSKAVFPKSIVRQITIAGNCSMINLGLRRFWETQP